VAEEVAQEQAAQEQAAPEQAAPAQTAEQRTVVIGVQLPPVGDGLHRWLRDAAALDAAGAHALWVDADDLGDWDPVAVVAALAAVTSRALLVVALDNVTLAELSRGRVRHPNNGNPHNGDTNDGDQNNMDGQRWESVSMPEGRSGWRVMLAEAKERQVDGVVVPADARLLDLLRNPDGEDDRRDLQLAIG
jgi:hypothetical protein